MRQHNFNGLFCGGYANDGLIETAQDNNIVQTDMFTYIFARKQK